MERQLSVGQHLRELRFRLIISVLSVLPGGRGRGYLLRGLGGPAQAVGELRRRRRTPTGADATHGDAGRVGEGEPAGGNRAGVPGDAVPSGEVCVAGADATGAAVLVGLSTGELGVLRCGVRFRLFRPAAAGLGFSAGLRERRGGTSNQDWQLHQRDGDVDVLDGNSVRDAVGDVPAGQAGDSDGAKGLDGGGATG